MESHIISIENVFIKLYGNDSSIRLNDKKLELFINGVKLTSNAQDGLYRIYCEKKFIGVGSVKNNLLKREIVV